MSDSQRPRPPRPIAPAPGDSTDESPHPASSSRPAPPRRTSSDDTSLPARKHKTTACEACKNKKLKCRGGPPCNHCVANGIDCQIDEWSDMRRKGAIERRIDRLEDAEHLLLNLMEVLKKDDRNMRVSQLINLVRSNASLDEIQVFLERQFSQEDLERMPQVVETQNHLARMPKDETCARPGRRMMGIQRLVDIPIYRVPAKPWTTMTDDDDLVSHLISIWFTWSHPWFHWVNRDLFLQDMRAGNVDCEFCSPFLVNAILAETSLYSDYPEVFTVPDDMMARGTHFHEEAQRLLEEEQGSPASIPMIQGLATFFVRIAMTGKDRTGWVYLDMAVRAAKEYDALHPYRPTDQDAVRMVEDAVNETLWGIFNVYSTVNLCALRHVDIEPPHRPRPPVSHEDPRDAWTSYPKQMASMPSHLSCVFHRWCDLCCIMINVTRTFFNAEGKLSPSNIPVSGQNIERQLQGWYANLPDCLRVEETTVPHVFILHMFYNTICLQLCSFLKCQVSETTDPARLEYIRSRRFAIARHVATLFAMHRRQWGIERMHPSGIQCVAVSCFALFEGLDRPENGDALITLCYVARDLGRHFVLAWGVLWMIQFFARQMNIELPEEIDALFQEFEASGWMAEDPIQFNSLYLNAMDQFLQKGDPGSIEYEPQDEKYRPDWNHL